MNEHIKDIKIQSPDSIAWVALLNVKQAIKSFDGYQGKYISYYTHIHIIQYRSNLCLLWYYLCLIQYNIS